jgi:hypothetical protein
MALLASSQVRDRVAGRRRRYGSGDLASAPGRMAYGQWRKKGHENDGNEIYVRWRHASRTYSESATANLYRESHMRDINQPIFRRKASLTTYLAASHCKGDGPASTEIYCLETQMKQANILIPCNDIKLAMARASATRPIELQHQANTSATAR